MNMAMNQAVAGGPVGGGMMMMNNGSPAIQPNTNTPDQLRAMLNTYVYEYFLKSGHFEIARALVREDKFEIRTKPPVKQSPGRRKDGEVNGVDGDGMDLDQKDDIPDDLPRPIQESSPGNGFLFEWFSIFSDLYSAHRSSHKMQAGNVGPAAQYLMQHQNMQRMRENQQNQSLARPGMMNPNQYAMARAGMRNGMVNGQMPRGDLAKAMTPQQLQQYQAQAQAQAKAQMMQQQQQQAAAQQQQLQREQVEVDLNGRPATPADGENGGSPSKRPRLENQQQFNAAMMPNGRPGMPGVAPQGMMIQNSFNPNMNQAQFRPNGAMPPKAMQPGMANGMMNMANAGSPMMQAINPTQFNEAMAMDMYAGRMQGQPMPGAPGAQSGNHALQDYQMQLMLLEQQNKKRLMMARQEQDNAVNRDGAPIQVMQATGMSPSNSRSGTSPIPVDQMKRTPQMGMPGSPSAAEAMAGRSPAGMGFMNGMPAGDFNPAMFMKDNQGMIVPGAPMRPPTSMDMNALARQQGRMAGQFPGGQPMVQQPSQGQPQGMGTPGQRNEMPPPPGPTNSAQRNNQQPSSPGGSNPPSTPSQANKPNPKGKKAKDDNKKRPTKKNSTANAPSSENEPPATPTTSAPMTPVQPNTFNPNANKGGAPGMPTANQPQAAAPGMPPNQPALAQPDMSQQGAFGDFGTSEHTFNLDFSTLENSDVLDSFDFDTFLNTNTDDAFNFDQAMVGGDFSLDTTGE